MDWFREGHVAQTKLIRPLLRSFVDNLGSSYPRVMSHEHAATLELLEAHLTNHVRKSHYQLMRQIEALEKKVFMWQSLLDSDESEGWNNCLLEQQG